MTELSENSGLQRYDRQMRFRPLGVEGQQSLLKSRVLVCGCGALGSVSAELLARAGVGHLRIVDRDFLELNNLQRQSLYDEADVSSGLPKAEAAARKLRRINSEIQIEPIVADVGSKNISSLMDGCDLVMDGTDNFETRFLLNDACLEYRVPWVFAGCLGAEGQTMTVVPEQSACLHCLMPDGPPEPGTMPTCDNAGILATIISVMASIQVTEALKILGGQIDQVSRSLTVINLWDNQYRSLDTSQLRDQGPCPACVQGKRDWLHGQRGSHATLLCGRNAVQVRLSDESRFDLSAIAGQIPVDQISLRNEFMLRVVHEDLHLTLFPDGRVIVNGTEDEHRAKSAVARVVGH